MVGSTDSGWFNYPTVMERVIYDAGSLQDARLVEFMGLDGEWRWPLVSLDLMNIWDRI